MKNRWKLSRRHERKLYLDAIDLLNDAFRRMGVIPTIGVEDEFYVEYKLDIHNWCRLSSVTDDSDNSLLEWIERLNNKGIATKDDIAILNNGPVSDVCPEARPKKYETASSPFYANSKAVEAMEEIRAHTMGMMLQYGGAHSDEEAKRLRQQYKFRLSHKAFPEKDTTLGLHTSIGFLVERDGKEYDGFAGSSKHRPYEPEGFLYTIKGKEPSLMLLYAPKPESYKRYYSGYTLSPKWHAVSKKKDNSSLRFEKRHTVVSGIPLKDSFASSYSCRIENRLPGADARFYKAILGTMLSAYAALLETAELGADGKVMCDQDGQIMYKSGLPYVPDQRIAADIHEAADDFKKGKEIWKLLDDLSPGRHIGSAIYEHEMDRYACIKVMGEVPDGAERIL